MFVFSIWNVRKHKCAAMKGQGKFQKIKGGGVGGGCIHAVFFVVVVCFLSW